jgi:hypothetical protein
MLSLPRLGRWDWGSSSVSLIPTLINGVFVTDPTLRLPNSMFRAVLDLGELPLNGPPLPRRFRQPELDADWDEEAGITELFVGFEDGELHLEASDGRIDHHFHRPDGDDVVASPWGPDDTSALVQWATRVMNHLLPLLPRLFEDAEAAAEWHLAGLSVFARNTDPIPLQVLDVEMEGEHTDGPDHPIVLLWNPEHAEPDIPIARAWLNSKTGEPKSKAEFRVDWTAVGMPKAEVLSWLEGVYLNHHVLEDPAEAILRAALERIAGVDHQH